MTKTTISLLVLLALTGCATSETKEGYNVDLYHNGKLVRSFEDVKLTENVPGKVSFVSDGTRISYSGPYALSDCRQARSIAPAMQGSYNTAQCTPIIQAQAVRVD